MSRSEALFERAKHTIPGGVNSPVRAFKAVGGTPRFMERAEGAYLFDADASPHMSAYLFLCRLGNKFHLGQTSENRLPRAKAQG